MFKKLVSSQKQKGPSALSALERLQETMEMLEKKEHVLQKKIIAEVEKAKDYTKLKNKKGINLKDQRVLHIRRGEKIEVLSVDDRSLKNPSSITFSAIQCLKKKKLYEAQIEQIGNFQLRVHDQMIMFEGAKATTDTINALKTGSAAMKSLQKSLSVDEIDKTMEHVNEQSESMKQIQESLAASVGVMAADFDEEELEAELEELEEEELEEFLQPPSTIPSVQMPVSEHPQRASGQRSSHVDELATLQAEMAL